MSVRAPVGPVNFATQEICIGRGLAAIRCRPELNRDFLFYQIVYLQPEIGGKEGAVFASINKSEIEDLRIAYAPLAQQRRIVGLLDEAFAGLATATANTQWNLQNARALYEVERQVALTPAETWSRVRIEETCDSIIDCVNKTAPRVDAPTPFKMIRTTNVRDGRVNLDSVYYVTEEIYRSWTRRQVPKRGDVILTREAPLGEVGILLNDDKVFLGQRLVSYRANPKVIENRFLLYALQSPDLQNQIHALASGATVQHMRVPDSKNLQISLPSLRDQRDIVAKLDAIREKTDRLEKIYRQKLTALAALKKSLLHHAFNSEL